MKTAFSKKDGEILDFGFIKQIAFVNALRKMGEKFSDYESEVRRAAEMCEQSFQYWISSHEIKSKINPYVNLAYPFITFIFRTTPGKEQVRLSPITANKKDAFLLLYIDTTTEHKKIINDKEFINESFIYLSKFFEHLESKNTNEI